MKLSAPQCLQLIKAPANADALYLAKKQEWRLLFHCEPILERSSCTTPALNDFLLWVKSFLPPDKFVRFEQLLQFPLETVDSTESIFDELGKFFDTPDGYSRYEFTTPTMAQDFEQYLDNRLNDSNFWKEHGLSALKTGINNFVIVDLPRQQIGPRPEPYYYILSVFRVHDVVINEETGAVEYIIFREKDGRLVCIDELAYRVFKRKQDSDEYELESEAIHSRYQQTAGEAEGETVYGPVIDGLGYTPACSFWEHCIKGSRGLNKRGPITNTLSKLDWLLFWKTSKKYLDLYGAWPIVVAYKSECDYRDEHGNECEEGFINYEIVDRLNGEHRTKAQKECPACSKRGLIGPGSFWTVDAPRDKDEADLMQNPVKIIEPSNDKLDYGIKEILRLEEEIFVNTVGYYKEASKEAINEKQVRSQYETRKAILDRIREQFDSTRRFAIETVARLRYGSYFISASIFGGQEYFINTAEEIAEQYANAKKAGMPSYEIARLRETYSRTKLRSNPMELQRNYILGQLEPYPDLTISELRTLGIDAVDTIGFLLKLNFVDFINKFEREQMNVVQFGSLAPFATKIEIIHSKLLDYVRDYSKNSVARPEPAANAGAQK